MGGVYQTYVHRLIIVIGLTINICFKLKIEALFHTQAKINFLLYHFKFYALYYLIFQFISNPFTFHFQPYLWLSFTISILYFHLYFLSTQKLANYLFRYFFGVAQGLIAEEHSSFLSKIFRLRGINHANHPNTIN